MPHREARADDGGSARVDARQSGEVVLEPDEGRADRSVPAVIRVFRAAEGESQEPLPLRRGQRR